MTDRFHFRKLNKRLHIMDGDVSCYSPPDFVRVPNRAAMAALVDQFNRAGGRDIDAIVAFEETSNVRK